jgi:hypothetical protein
MAIKARSFFGLSIALLVFSVGGLIVGILALEGFAIAVAVLQLIVASLGITAAIKRNRIMIITVPSDALDILTIFQRK